MELHEIIESDGLKRQIIGFDSEGRPVTEPYNGEAIKEEEPPNEETKAPSKEEPRELVKEQLPTEETVTIDGEPIAIETVEPTAKPTGEVLKCQYCGRIIKSKVGLASHEKACKENPANK